MRGCQSTWGLTSTGGKGAGTTLRPGTAARSLKIRLGRVAIKSVFATTNGKPAALGSTTAIRRWRPRAARIAIDEAGPLAVPVDLNMAGVDGVVGAGERIERHRQRQRVVRADQRDEPIAPQRLGVQVATSGQNRRDREIEFPGCELIVKPVAFNRLKMQIETGRVARATARQEPAAGSIWCRSMVAIRTIVRPLPGSNAWAARGCARCRTARHGSGPPAPAPAASAPCARRAARTERSPRRWRSLLRALLIAGWLRPLCRAARVTLRSAISASNARRRLRLTPRIFLSVIPGIFFFHFLSVRSSCHHPLQRSIRRAR